MGKYNKFTSCLILPVGVVQMDRSILLQPHKPGYSLLNKANNLVLLDA